MNGQTAVMERAEARLSASIMMSCSITHVLIGSVCDCITNTSAPRTGSVNRMYISPFAKS